MPDIRCANPNYWTFPQSLMVTSGAVAAGEIAARVRLPRGLARTSVSTTWCFAIRCDAAPSSIATITDNVGRSSRGCGRSYLISEMRCAREGFEGIEKPARRFVFRRRASANGWQIGPASGLSWRLASSRIASSAPARTRKWIDCIAHQCAHTRRAAASRASSSAAGQAPARSVSHKCRRL